MITSLPIEETWVPQSCTLPTVEQPLRVAEFDSLFSETLVSVERRATAHVRMILAGDDSLPDRAQSLGNRETACCSFFAFTVQRLPSAEGVEPVSVTVDIVVPTGQASVLAALVDRAESLAGL